ncbi:hypothetical protein GCM10010960_10660 [Arenimonas maotaiensis]|uniref:TIGR02281 family clan AA aspartic protease n=1 Tax=Arenimonas maotaiensis TaxID=1446479 RepID=A0A917CLY8_9GAMM|nr:retropepsin-like aspartic protease [Arenimonas maotaiensis]GGF90616.1 hypothetical protein GCM10010960_10660 [Arenimonas maotaiensis]
MKRAILSAVVLAILAYWLGRLHGAQEQIAEHNAFWNTLQADIERQRAQAAARAPGPDTVSAPKPAPQKILFHGQQAIERSADGHYYLDGAVNGTPVRFLIDTGASLSVVSADLAKRAGVTECLPAEFRTAMGVDRDVCVAKVQRLDFGQFSFRDVYIGISKNLAGDALLGMNVLKDLKIEQSGASLVLESDWKRDGG